MSGKKFYTRRLRHYRVHTTKEHGKVTAVVAVLLLSLFFMRPENMPQDADIIIWLRFFYTTWTTFLFKVWMDVVNALVLLLPVLGFLYYYFAGRREGFLLDASGVRYQSAFPGIFQIFRPGWYVSRATLRAATLRYSSLQMLPGGPLNVVLELDTRQGCKKLTPCI
jgi:hypothetical protein